jgi:hypothetical protein
MPLLILVAGTALVLPAPTAAQNRKQRPSVDMPRGPMRDVLRRTCTGCHGIDDYAYHALDRTGWTNLIETLCVKNGAKHFTGSDKEAVLDYLVTNFGPQSVPFPRTYVPPEITTFFSNEEGNAFLQKNCVQCHSLQRVLDGTRRSVEGWRVLIVNMREKGIVMGDEDVERLTEWLYRTRGTAATDI